MAVRNQHTESVTDFKGLNSLDDATNLTPNWWIESNNTIVTSSGSAVALRSPLMWGLNPTGPGLLQYSIFHWDRAAGAQIVIDLGTVVSTVTSDGANYVVRRTGQAGARFKRLNVNDKCYGVNGAEAIQMEPTGFNTYKIGIDRPAAAPTATIVAAGALTLNVGVTASYAYRNSTTLHVGQCSAASSSSGPTGAGNTLRIAVVASAQTGVDGIVVFLSTDGGATRYLVVDAAGAPIVYANTTGNINYAASFVLDTNTVETAFSARPSDLARFMFSHQNRIFMLNFAAAATRWQVIYSGLEAIGIGQPTEAFPPLNIIGLPVKSESGMCGISTPVGALILSDSNAYLLQGTVTDNVVSAQNTIQAAAVLQELKWSIGTKSPYTLVNTPFGAMWLDQNNRWQLWDYVGFPVEIGIPLRNELSPILTEPNNTLVVYGGSPEAIWFQAADVSCCIMAATPLNNSLHPKTYIIGAYRDPKSGQTQWTYAVSDIRPGCLCITRGIDSISRGTTALMGRLDGSGGGNSSFPQEILNLNAQGDGWETGTTIYCGVTSGNFETNNNFNHLHSLRFDSGAPDIQVQTRQMDNANIETSPTEVIDTSYFAMLDRYGVHNKVKFSFPVNDSMRREIRNLRLTYSAKGRSI